VKRGATILEVLGRPALALLVALLVGGVFIAVVQGDIAAPFRAYGALFTGAFGGAQGWANTLKQTTPLLLTGAAVAVALAAGLFNIGAEGQMAVGALAGAVAGNALKDVLPAPLLLLISLTIGGAAGAAWGFLPAFLKVRRGAHEVITAILLNYVAQNVTRYLATFTLKAPDSMSPATREVGATLPRLSPQYDVHAGLIVATLTVIFIAVALRRSIWGYETRATGEGIGAAEAAGIAVGRVQILAMMASGALAGLAGAVAVLGETPFRRFPADFYGIGYGFDGLAVALLAAPGGTASVWGIFPAALLFGALSAGALEMEFNDTPKQIVAVVQAALIIAVAARFVLRRSRAGGTPPVSAGKEPA
jgi:general nucleoside transport system permease protein